MLFAIDLNEYDDESNILENESQLIDENVDEIISGYLCLNNSSESEDDESYQNINELSLDEF